ncbi:hypothetical protein MTX78_14560 [Hymenobacter tibetensis]|uniref:Uncharacterized protein n=1 Tax=Hymenobacter tibetensis TaxID=497967 RepID=A0ABY4CSW8_9BACT|nr:hypothetical protein [Hymenobacter tibetensis]UOG73345.1 hypothetical protein MTX78_14560 [Hymenobacter tibetensis]
MLVAELVGQLLHSAVCLTQQGGRLFHPPRQQPAARATAVELGKAALEGGQTHMAQKSQFLDGNRTADMRSNDLPDPYLLVGLLAYTVQLLELPGALEGQVQQ